MERKVGEIFEYKGEWYQCVSDTTDDNCNNCYFQKNCSNITGDCSSTARSDGKSVAFKKLEKVGEPRIKALLSNPAQHLLVQKYRVEVTPSIMPNEPPIHFNVLDNTIEVEIKSPIKEAMEEKEQCCDNRFEVIEKAKRHLLHSTNIENNKEEMKLLDVFLFRCWQMGWLDSYDDAKHSNSESIGKNLRSFDLEAAKAGKPVCTRDGRKARIICFDRVGDFPIVALTDDRDYKEEGVNLYDINGKGSNECFDLMMLPEKKEGWVNVYYDNDASSHRGCRFIYDTEEQAVKEACSDCIATIKIEWEE